MKESDSTESLPTTHVAELLEDVVNRAAATGTPKDVVDPTLRALLARMLAPDVDLKSVVADELERALHI